LQSYTLLLFAAKKRESYLFIYFDRFVVIRSKTSRSTGRSKKVRRKSLPSPAAGQAGKSQY